MKKILLLLTTVAMMSGCAPKEHTITFEELSLWGFNGCVTHNLSYEEKRQLIMSSYLSFEDCTLKIISLTPKFRPKEYKKVLESIRYKSESMDEKPENTLEDYENKGVFVTPSGDGYIEIYNSQHVKICEIMYQKGLPYSLKLWDSMGLFYEAEGIFDKYHDGDFERYKFLSGHCKLNHMPN